METMYQQVPLPFQIGSDLLTKSGYWELTQQVGNKSLLEAWRRFKQLYMDADTHRYRRRGIIDWPYQELRYELLKAYMSSLSMSDLIETTNITEYRVSKEEKKRLSAKTLSVNINGKFTTKTVIFLKTTHTYGRTLRVVL